MQYFIDVLPEACVVFTSLPNKNFDTGTDAKWLNDNIKIAIVSFLGLQPGKEFDAVVQKVDNHKYRRMVIPSFSQTDLHAGKSIEQAPLALSAFNLREEDFKLLPIGMQDPLGKTGLISFCFFFKKSALQEQPTKMIACSNCDNQVQIPVSGYFQFSCPQCGSKHEFENGKEMSIKSQDKKKQWWKFW